jgi:hypothetical protein
LVFVQIKCLYNKLITNETLKCLTLWQIKLNYVAHFKHQSHTLGQTYYGGTGLLVGLQMSEEVHDVAAYRLVDED